MKEKVLPEKYRKALQLIEEANLSFKHIANECGIPEDTFYNLIEGRADDYGKIGEMFTSELNAINKRRDKEIKNLLKKNKKSTQYIIDRYLCDHKNRKNIDKTMPTIVAIANALSKSTPNVEIDKFMYQKGLSIEDIHAEFKRLNGLASDRGAVQRSATGGKGEIPLASGPRAPIEEEQEDSLL